MNEEMKEHGKWWMWTILLIVVSIIVFTLLSYLGVIGQTIVERKVFENSYQRSEGLKQQISIYEAQLAELNMNLQSVHLSNLDKDNIRAQVSAIRIQLRAARSRQ